MSIISSITSRLLAILRPPAQAPVLFNAEHFIYVKLPGAIGPADRGERYEDRIDPVLAQEGLGSVSGGGSSLGVEGPDGSRAIEFCGIDIDVTDCERARAVLRKLLPVLQAPFGTELHYTRSGVRLQDEYGSAGWVLEMPRTFLHPGWGV